MNQPSTNSTQDFKSRYTGSFYGVLKWSDLDQLWSTVKSQMNDDWFIYSPGQDVPDKTTKAEYVITFIDEIDQLLRREHEKDYCGVVYVDDKENPSFIKIFDPNNRGVSCGFSDNPPLPGWILSKIKPVELEKALNPPNNRRNWWQKIFD